MTVKPMNWIPAVLLCALMCNAQAAHLLSGDQLQQQIALGLLLEADADQTRLGAKTIGQIYSNQTELMDCVAEMMSRSIGVRQVGDTIDVMAVYAAVLGKSKNPRYRDVLLTARRGKNEDKVVREIDAALNLIGKLQVDQYRPRTIDIVARANEVSKTLSDNREANRIALRKTKVGTDMPIVLDELGAPDDVSVITQVGSIGRRAMIVAHYYGQGLIAFKLERDTDAHWTAFEIDDEKVSVDNYRGTQKWFAHALASMRGIQYRNLIRFYQERIQNDPEIIPVLTQRLIVMDDLDDYEEDATEYIPEVLKGRSSPNEMVRWEEVVAKARTRVVRKVAAARIAQLKKMRAK